MNKWESVPLYIKIAAVLVSLTLIITGLVVAREFLIPFTLAVFFTFLLIPVTKWLVKFKVPHVIAILISIFLTLVFFGAIIYFLYLQVVSFADEWPKLKESLLDKWNVIQQFIYSKFNVTEQQQKLWLSQRIAESAKSGGAVAVGIFTATTSFIINVALIPVYIFFLLYYQDKIKKFLLLLPQQHDSGKTLNIVKKISTVSQKYLKGVILDVLILSVLNSTGFLLLDLDHAILFGVLASFLNIIPYIGVLIGSALPFVMALLTKDEIGYALGVIGVTIVVQFLDNNIIGPTVVGSSVSLNPLSAVVALIIGSMIWGLPGMILAVPLTGMLKVVCDHVDSLKPYGYLLGEEKHYRKQKKSGG